MRDFIKRVNEYYPTYLLAHQNPWNKLIHMIGNLVVVSTAGFIIYESFLNFPRSLGLLLTLPFVLTYMIYLFAWPGHLLIEKNEPATWKVSRWITKACDWKMMFQLITRKLKWDTRAKMNLGFALGKPNQIIKMIGTVDYTKGITKEQIDRFDPPEQKLLKLTEEQKEMLRKFK